DLGLLHSRRSMIMATTRPVHMALLRFEVGLELRPARLAVADFGAREEEVDNLVLVQRRAQLCREHWLALDQIEEALLLLALILRRRLNDQRAHLLLADLDPVGAADLRQKQAQAHPALGDVPVIVG